MGKSKKTKRNQYQEEDENDNITIVIESIVNEMNELFCKLQETEDIDEREKINKKYNSLVVQLNAIRC
jgi:hypothetical protein